MTIFECQFSEHFIEHHMHTSTTTTSVYLSKIENSLQIKRIIKHEQQPVAAEYEFTHTGCYDF